MPRCRRVNRWAAIVLLLVLPACTITFRKKPLEPVDDDRSFDAPVARTWEVVQQVVTDFVKGVERVEFEDDAGIIVTEFAVLPDTGPDYQRLDEVALAQGYPFIGGRYSLTVTVRQVQGGQSKVRVVPRLEGYLGEEYGYQALRTTGVLEQELFNRISNQLGVAPISEAEPARQAAAATR